MIGYDAAWGVKRMDARAAYQKPGRVMFLRESRVGSGDGRLQTRPIGQFWKNGGIDEEFLDPVLASLEAGLVSDTDGQPIPKDPDDPNDPNLLVLVDWEADVYDSSTAVFLAGLDPPEDPLQGLTPAQYDAIQEWRWKKIYAKWRELRSYVRWGCYQCVQHHRWASGANGWINNRQEDGVSDEQAQIDMVGPWVSRRQGNPDAFRGWLYDLVDVLAVHCYHNRLVGWDGNGNPPFETIREFHHDECRHGIWLSQTRYGGRKPVIPYVAWWGQGFASEGTVGAVAGGTTQITLSTGAQTIEDDFYRFAVFRANLPGGPEGPAVRVERYDALNKVVTLRSAYPGAIKAGWEYKIDTIPCRTVDAKAWLEGYEEARARGMMPWAMWGAIPDAEAAWATRGILDERVSRAINQQYGAQLGFVPQLRVSR